MDCPVWQKSCAGKMQNGNKTPDKESLNDEKLNEIKLNEIVTL